MLVLGRCDRRDSLQLVWDPSQLRAAHRVVPFGKTNGLDFIAAVETLKR